MSFFDDIKIIKDGQIPLVTLVLGREKYLIERAEQTILDVAFPSGEIDEFSFGRFDMEEVSLDLALEEANSIPFFSNFRLIFIENPYFLRSQTVKNDLDHDTDGLLEYIESPSESSRLVIFAPYDSLDKRRKVNKSLLQNAYLISTEAMDANESRRYLQTYLSTSGYQMSSEAFDLFLELTDNDLTKMMNEIDKLFILRHEEKFIHKQDVLDLVPKSLNQDVFSLNEAVLQKDLQKALEVYRDLLLQKESPINLTALMISQFRLFLQVKILRSKGYQQYDIQKLLNVHKYRVYLAIKSESSYQKEALMQVLQEIIKLDYKIKTGQVDPQNALELFIIQYCRS